MALPNYLPIGRLDRGVVNAVTFTRSTAAGLTAHAGGTQAAALPLTADVNVLSTVATAGDSVKLPVSITGMIIKIFNNGAAAAQVFGAGTDTIDGVATATGVVLTNAKRCDYVCTLGAQSGTPGTWISAQMGVTSA